MLETWKSRKEVPSTIIRGDRQPKLSEEWRRNLRVGSLPHELQDEESFSLQGTVFECSGAALAGASALIFAREQGGQQTLMGKGITAGDGRFYIGSIPCTDLPLVCCIFCDGYEPHFRALHCPADGSQGVIDVILPDAFAAEVHLQAKEGAALSGLQISISTGLADFFPITYTSDENGLVLTQAILRPGRKYQLLAMSADLKLASKWLELEDSPSLEDGFQKPRFEIPFEIEGIGKLTQLPPELQLSEISYSSRSHAPSNGGLWCTASETPWLPSGDGVLTILRQGQPAQIMRIHIPVGIHPWNDGQHVTEKLFAPA